ncbi:unnamed protein product, partial [Cuscuta europaea]
MAGKKVGKGGATPSMSTRSRASAGFSVLEDLDVDFPILQAGNGKLTQGSPAGSRIENPSTDLQVSSNPGNKEVTAGIGKLTQGSPAGSGIVYETSATELQVNSKPGNKQVTAAMLTSSGKQGTDTVALSAPGENDNIKVSIASAVVTPTAAPKSQTVMKPWSNLFKDNRAPAHGIKLKYIPPKGNSLDFAGRVLPSMIDMWGHCLVGCFTGTFPGLKAIYELREKWGVRCLIRPHDKGWVIFKFQNEVDRAKVLNEGPYNIFGKLLMLKELGDDFSFDDEEFLKVPIWVKFPNLPLKLWNDEAMSEIASMVGVPLTTDKVTQEKINHHFARVLIEVDISKPPPLSFPIRLPSRKVFNQTVVYETFPNFCFHCKEYGHHPFICKKLAEKEREATIPEIETVKDAEPEKTTLDPPAAAPASLETAVPEPGTTTLACLVAATPQRAASFSAVAISAATSQAADHASLAAAPAAAIPAAAHAPQPPAVHASQLTAGVDIEMKVGREPDVLKTAAPVPQVAAKRNKKKKMNTGRPKTIKSAARAPKRIEHESSGETDSSWEEDLGSDFDEVYMDGKVFTIRKDAKVCRNRMIRRIPGLSWEDTFTKKKM